MAQVVHEQQLVEWIDDYLAYLEREWRSVPEVAREWDTWEDHEQLDFVVEWPIREDRLGQLRRWAEQGVLTPSQWAQYERLLKLVAKHRPALERLLQD